MRHAMYCAVGHLLSADNVTPRYRNGAIAGRRCKTCQQRFDRESKQRRRAAKKAEGNE